MNLSIFADTAAGVFIPAPAAVLISLSQNPI